MELLGETNNIQAAVDIFMERVAKDRALRDRVIDKAVRPYLAGVVRSIAGRDRRIADGSRAGRPSSVSIEDWAGAVTMALMDTFRLPGGLLLGDALRPEVVLAAGAYKTTAVDADVKSKWLTKVADALPDDRTFVRAALTEEKVRALKASALKEASD